jgi:magnesium-transporting ATPase (P-type)
LTAGQSVGITSLLVLAIAIFARCGRHLAGPWRWIYVVTATIVLYLNVFVGIVQAFQKVPALKAIAPMQTEPPFAITQLVVLVLFILIGIVVAIRFRPELTRVM